MPQLIRIAHDVQRPNHAVLHFERRRLYGSLRRFHNDARKTVDTCEAQREILTPAFTRGADQKSRGVIRAMNHVQGRRSLAAAIRHHTNITRQHLRERAEIARSRRRHERGYKLLMLRADPARSRRRSDSPARPRFAYMLACARGKLTARGFAPLQRRGY